MKNNKSENKSERITIRFTKEEVKYLESRVFCENISISDLIRKLLGLEKVIKHSKYEYFTIHRWVYKELGKPTKCEECGKDNLTKNKIHWSNMSGEYKREITDWQRLCVKCHKKYHKDKIKGIIRKRFGKNEDKKLSTV